MFIQTEPTPNPATVKFLPGQTVMPAGTLNFSNPDDAASSPLAADLFDLVGVSNVFFGADFISVTLSPDGDWTLAKPQILAAIMTHLSSGQPITKGGVVITPSHDDDDDITAQIRELIETRVRPAVAQDGGDIVFDRFEKGIVYLHMQGACSGCPSSSMTLKSGIENMLRHFIPEVLEVRPVEN
jgi:Fe-S cluster biogenesis protein NfuA